MVEDRSDPRRRRSNYRSLGLVGQGQFGQVYCAVHRKTGQLVALKNLNRDRLNTHRFLRELRFLLSLEHSNIANCHTLEHSANGRQIVLDYCEGGTLRSLIDQEAQFSLPEVIALIVELLTALDHAHQAGIVHCDIKPENVLLVITPGGWQVKVSDFGIARLNQELKGQHSGATGSPAYMAPERFYHQYSVASDIYAVGIILFELLVGDRPFSGTPSQLMVAHLNQSVMIPPQVPAALHEPLKKALRKLAGQRFRSAGEMKAALLAAQQHLPLDTLDKRYPPQYAEPEPTTYQPMQVRSRSTPGDCLAVRALPMPLTGSEGDAPVEVIVARDRQIQTEIHTETGWQRPSSPSWTLPCPVQHLWSLPSGIVALGDRTLYRLPPADAALPLVTFSEAVTVTASPNGRWWLAHSLAAPRLWLWDSLSTAPPRPISVPKVAIALQHSLMIDNHHLIGADQQTRHTALWIMTRRGHPLGVLPLRTRITRLFRTQTPYRLLACEPGDPPALLIVDLKPFRVVRCRLDIEPVWCGALIIGFACLSATGELRLVNEQGQVIGRVDGLPPARAIAAHAPYQMYLIPQLPNPPSVHSIDIRDLGLDIVF
ncbi:MAG: serine/threonine protein kinase [Leptolyngbyaceae cyanobacterium T60_A2020_046]|nr:serine/threonine protein kinase [Leptolyngbyaceae cyanobacterium T60_A2020_046]